MSYRSTRNRSHLFFLPLLALLLFTFCGLSQTTVIHGRVISESDQSPLPFVHLRFDQGNSGTISNIDGNFTIPDTVRQIRFSYIGFKPLQLPVVKSLETSWIISLVPDNKFLSTIEIYPGKNPALRIMQAVLNHADLNNPDQLESYQCTAYHKFWLSADTPFEEKMSGKQKISTFELEKLQKRFDENHMLLIETLSRKNFFSPNI